MPGDTPLVSVLMTSFNREKYITEAIESVLCSTFSDFELIIVDDCSSDNTVNIAKQFAQKDSRIRLFQNEKNLGDYPNRNQAVGYARGKYLKFVDSDDMIYPASLAQFVGAMEDFPEAAVGIMSRDDVKEKNFPILLQPAEAYRRHFFQQGLFDTGPSGLIFRATRFREIGGFSGKRFVGDTEINLRLASQWPVLLLPPALIFWRQHEGQEIVQGMSSIGYLELQLPLFRDELSKKECPLNEKEKKSVLSYYTKISAREVIKLALIKKSPGMAIKTGRKLKLKGADFLKAVFM